jgi:hypothetical protein
MDESMVFIFYQGFTLKPLETAAIWAISTMVRPLDLVGGVYWAQFFAMPRRSEDVSLRMID